MSSIVRMSILGIRSFGPDESDLGVIHFFQPLTLILGQNGTGKTTIIECLKYMTTGEMPPGAKTGGAFIHDPKIAGEREVKAQVRLQFRDCRGDLYVVNRSLSAVQKAKNVTMSTLDCVITRCQKDGTKVDLTQRCADINREMVSLLGVSKPILDSVIFCHQEESNWPLGEGKALKQRFDDIFASTRYVKALEAIRKYHQDQSQAVKEYRIDVKHLKQYKDKSAEIKSELALRETRYKAAKDTVDNVNSRITPIEDQLMKIQDCTQNVTDIQKEIAGKQAELVQVHRGIDELKSQITQLYLGSEMELRRELSQFEGKVKDRETLLNQLQKCVDDLEIKKERMNDDKQKLLVEKGKLEQEAERHRDHIQKRDTTVQRIAAQQGIDGYIGHMADNKVEAFLEELERKEKIHTETARMTRSGYEQREKNLQVEIDKLRKQQASLETTIKMKRDRLNQNVIDLKTVHQELSLIASSGERLSDIDRRLRQKQAELSDTEKSVDGDRLREEVSALQRDRLRLDASVKSLESQLTEAMRNASTQSELDLLTKERAGREDAVRRLLAKNDESLRHILGGVPVDSLGRALDAYCLKQGRLVRAAQATSQELRNKATRLSAERENLSAELRRKEEEVRGYGAELGEVCGGRRLESALGEVQKALHDEQDRKGTIDGMKFIYGKYIERLRAADPPCPLCHRPFDSPGEVDELMRELEQKLQLVPQKLEESTHKIERFRKQYDQIQQVTPFSVKLVAIRDEEIPRLRERLTSTDEQLATVSTKLSEKEAELETLQGDEKTATQLHSDATLIDRFNNELKEVERKIATQQAKLGGAGASRSLQSIQHEKEEVQLQLESVNRNLDLKRDRINEHTDRCQKMRAEVNDLHSEKVKVEGQLQQRGRLEERISSLEEENGALEGEMDDAHDELAPLQEKISTQVSEQQLVTRDKESSWDKDTSTGDSIKQAKRQVAEIHSLVRSYVLEGREQLLVNCQQKLVEAEDKHKGLMRDFNETSEQMANTRKELDEQRSNQRDLQDNLRLLERDTHARRVRVDLDALQSRLGGIDLNNLEGERRALQRNLEQLQGEKHQSEGRKVQLDIEIKRFKKELNEEQYRQAEDKYRDKMITLRTTELAIEDLDKYYKALDRAIMSYHSTKMAEINKIIRELWRNTYRGNDIDTIEIRSDEEEVSTMKRRTYHYRVVMLKGSTALDMRGRCSAGQKVLASLIIRLALAETFCINCGILALDEPTTNLDRENIESLAYALVEIINSRRRQRNFQLVVITHDEDFVELLGRSQYVDDFFKVRKNSNGLSRIAKAKVADLHR